MTNFKFLSDSEEHCLRYLLSRKNNIGFGNDDEIKFKDIDEKKQGFNKAHFASLKENGFIEANIWDHMVSYYLKSKAVDYFEEKKKYTRLEKKKNNKETRRYWLTTSIAILAMLIALVSLLNSIFRFWNFR